MVIFSTSEYVSLAFEDYYDDEVVCATCRPLEEVDARMQALRRDAKTYRHLRREDKRQRAARILAADHGLPESVVYSYVFGEGTLSWYEVPEVWHEG